MKFTSPRFIHHLVFHLFTFCFLLLLASCSTDEIKEGAPIDSESGEGGSNENGEEPKNDTETPTSGSVEFEEGFVLGKDRLFTSLVLSTTEYTKFISGEGDLHMVSEKAYAFLKDDFDFIIILSVEESQPDGLFYGRSTSVQNQVQGLGGGTYDSSANYGSNGRLKSIIYMPRTEYIRNGPFLHEIVHTWGNKGFIPTTVGGHWGYAGTAGQLGGFDELVALGGNSYKGRLNGNDGFGSFANGGNSIPYGNLELYLMGLIGPEDLDDIQVAVNPEPGNAAGVFTADGIDLHTAAELIADHGTRLPTHENAQKAFKALAVVISTTSLDQDKIDAVHANLENFSRGAAPDASWGGANNFWMATQGKASFEFVVLQESIK